MTNFEEYAAEYADTRDLQVGDRVRYHGSLTEYHGREYVVSEIGPGIYGQQGALTLRSLSGKFDDHGSILRNARASSVTRIPGGINDAHKEVPQ